MKYALISPRYYWTLSKELASFVRRPEATEAAEKSVRRRVCDTVGLFVIKLLVLIPVALLMSVVYDPENLTSQNMAERFSPLQLLLVAGLILPLVEEVGFRLSLRFRPIYLAMSAGVFLYYILTKGVYQTKVSAVDESFPVRAAAAILMVALLYLVVRRTQVKRRLAQFWEDHFRWIYYVSCLVFAWIHLSKYEVIWLNILLLPVLTLPQLMSGIVSGYTRVKFGFAYPLGFHMGTNTLAVLLSFLPFAD